MKVFYPEDMADMIKHTRPSFFHYDKLTFSINNINDNKSQDGVFSLGVFFLPQEDYDITLILEDSKRKFCEQQIK